MKKKYIVPLTESERSDLKVTISSVKGAARRLAHARILLKANQGLSDSAVAEAVEVSRPTVSNWLAGIPKYDSAAAPTS